MEGLFSVEFLGWNALVFEWRGLRGVNAVTGGVDQFGGDEGNLGWDQSAFFCFRQEYEDLAIVDSTAALQSDIAAGGIHDGGGEPE